MLGEMASIQSKLVEKLLYKESVNPIIQDNSKINLQSLPSDIHEKISLYAGTTCLGFTTLSSMWLFVKM